MPASFFRLPLRFDAAPPKADLASLSDADWKAHFNAQYHNGGWAGIALRSIDGSPANLYPGPDGNRSYADTPILDRLPAIRRALRRFECPLDAVRLLRLRAGGAIHEHRDYGLGIELGIVRLHIPLISGADVEFYVDGMRVPMQEGECWYLDLSLPHRVHNRGSTDRIHLVLDCKVDGALLALFPSEDEVLAQRQEPHYLAALATSSQREFARFRAFVLQDPGLQEELRQRDDVAAFVERVVTVGHEAGFGFTREDVKAALQEGRRAAIERLIVG